jgi:hypothetical protein
MNTYLETDSLGEHKIIEQKNGIKIRLLKKPSKEYAAKLKVRGEKDKERMAKEKIEQDMEKLIRERVRENAIKELKKEGKI